MTWNLSVDWSEWRWNLLLWNHSVDWNRWRWNLSVWNHSVDWNGSRWNLSVWNHSANFHLSIYRPYAPLVDLSAVHPTCQSIGRTLHLSIYRPCSTCHVVWIIIIIIICSVPSQSDGRTNNNNNNSLYLSLFPTFLLEFQHPVFPVCFLSDACLRCSLFKALSVSAVLLSCCCLARAASDQYLSM